MNLIKFIIEEWGRKERTVECESSAQKPLLDLLEDQNIPLPYGCRSGTCGACRVRVKEGGSLLQEPSFIEETTLESIGVEFRLACRAQLKEQAQGVIRLEVPQEES